MRKKNPSSAHQSRYNARLLRCGIDFDSPQIDWPQRSGTCPWPPRFIASRAVTSTG